jgi:hypothetical protein
MGEGKMTDYKFPLIIYFILALLLISPLLGEGYYLSLDMTRGPNSFADFQFDDFYGHSANPYGSYLPLNMIQALLSLIIPVEIIQKGLLFLILFLCGASAHFALPKEMGNSRFFAGFLYTLNPFVFVRFLAGHWSFLLSYALWPISIKFFLDFLNKPNWNNLAKTALITFAASISSHGVILLLLCYFVIFLFHIIKNKERISLIKPTAILACLVLAMNLFWILPVAFSFGETVSPASTGDHLADFSAKGSDNLPIQQAILTMHGFWREGFTYTKDVFDHWIVPFVFIGALSFIGFITLFRKNWVLATSLAIIFILGFLLSLGDQNPLLGLFEWMPFYFLFRDSQKFVGLIALAYSFLGAYGVNSLAKRFTDQKKMLLLIVLLAIPIVYNFGFFGFLDQIGPTQYPSDWAAADKIITADNSSTKILVLPLHLYSQFKWVNSNQKTLATPASQFFSRPVITGSSLEMRHDRDDPNDQYIEQIFENKNNSAQMLSPLNIRYIILNKNTGETASYYEKLQKAPNISLIFEGSTIYLFKNNLANGSIESQPNQMFYLTLALLLLSWLIILVLLLNSTTKQMFLLIFLFIILYAFSSIFKLQPLILGTLLLLSLILAINYPYIYKYCQRVYKR